MSKPQIPLPIPDISAFARALTRQLSQDAAPPSHLALMNMLARAAGYRNFQHLRADQAAGARLQRPDRPAPAQPLDTRLVERALPHFDEAGRLRRWPGRRQVRSLCLEALVPHLPARRAMTEAEVNGCLSPRHLFDDVAQLRRGMIEDGLLTRQPDGSDYRRVGRAPSPEARMLIRLLADRPPA